jgi:peptidyl-prolyl cis-trans isomerase C
MPERSRRLVLLVLAAGCGGGKQEAPAPGPVVAPSLAEDPAGRTVVAEVDGRPIYGDCVATQAAAHHLDRKAALDECIAFELLAAEAERRGLAADPDVLSARETELARALIDREFAPSFDGPEDVPMEEVAGFYKEYKDQLYVHPEWRSSHHVLVGLGYKKVARGSARDQEARAIIDEVAAALRGKPVSADELDRVAKETAARFKAKKLQIKAEAVPGSLHDRLDVAYREALAQLPAIGALSGPVRSDFGWHLILLTQIEPAVNQSLEQAAADIRGKIFEAVRRRTFLRWAARYLPGKPQVDEALLAQLAAADAARLDLQPTTGAP